MRVSISGLIANCLFAAACFAGFTAIAQSASSSSVDVPQTEKLVVKLLGKGLQVYSCREKDGNWEWTYRAPEAMLVDDANKRVGRHFGGPKWRLNDGSEVLGKVIAMEPHEGTIPWLLLSATSTGGEGQLSKVDMVRRTDTTGGVAPTEGCDAAHAGNETRVVYTATYSFYRAH
jgi:hypothetical protein